MKSARKMPPPRPVSAKAGKRAAPAGLLVIDNEPIRKRILANYHKAERDLQRVRAQLEDFETVEIPAYQRWEAVTFGPLMTELRELLIGCAEKCRILDEIDEEVYLTGCSRITAYHRVINGERERRDTSRRNGQEDRHDEGDESSEEAFDPDSFEPKVFGTSDLPPGFRIEVFDAMNPSVQAQVRRFFEQVARQFTEFTGLPAPDFDDLLKRERAKARGIPEEEREIPRSPKGPEVPKSARIKELYRMLVRQLHPDHKGSEQTPRERELWDQVQNAYRDGDLESLEALAGRVEISSSKNAAKLSMQILMRMLRDLQNALRSLKRQVQSAQRHQAWKFSRNPKKQARQTEKIRRELDGQLALARREFALVKNELDALAQKAARPKRPSAGKKKPAAEKTSPKPFAKNRSSTRESQQEFFA